MYYPGWGVTVDGNPVTFDYKNENGLMQFPLARGEHHVIASFRETITRFIADIISVISFLIYFLISVRFISKVQSKMKK